jgi:hypothetical protein
MSVCLAAAFRCTSLFCSSMNLVKLSFGNLAHGSTPTSSSFCGNDVQPGGASFPGYRDAVHTSAMDDAWCERARALVYVNVCPTKL